MKIFKSKKLIQKIIISMFLLILVFNLVMPNVVYGTASDIVGGVLLNPLVDLVCSVGDSAINLVRSALDSKLGVTQVFRNDGVPFMVDADEYESVKQEIDKEKRRVK